MRNALKYPGNQPVPARRVQRLVLLEPALQNLHRRTKPHYSRNVLRAGPVFAFLSSAVNEVLGVNALPQIQRSDSLRAVHLVRAHRKHVDIHCLNVNLQVCGGLNCVCVEGYLPLSAQCTDLRDGLNRSDLVVREHYGHKSGLVGYGVLHVLNADSALAVYWKIRYFCSLVRFKVLCCVQDCVVLNAGRDDVVLAPMLCALESSLQRPVVCLSPRTSEEYLRRVCVQCGGDLASGFLDCCPALARE